VAARHGDGKGYEQLSADVPDMRKDMRLALEAGIGHEHEFIRFWSQQVSESTSE
jgi:hypothetical protein